VGDGVGGLVIEDGAGLHRERIGLLIGLRTLVSGVLSQPCQVTYLKVQPDSPGYTTYAKGEQVVASGIVDALAGGDGKSVGRYL
jgi:hypothetical protein